MENTSNKSFSNKLKLFLTWEHTPCLIYMLIMCIYHTAYSCAGDDADIMANILKPTIWEEFSSVVYNFNSWSSRVLVNLPIHLMLHLPYQIWLVIELVLFYVIFRSMSKIFIKENKTTNNYILLGVLLLFPFNYAITAGWVTTTMTYIWPLAFALLSCTTIRAVYEGKGFRWYHYVGLFFATLYGANQEQLSLILTMVFGTALLLLAKEKKLSLMIAMQTALSMGNLLLHMLAPGNSNRSEMEAALRFPDYGTLSLIDKLELGFSSSLYEFFFSANFGMLVMGMLIVYLVFVRTKNWFYRLIGLVPIMTQGVFGCFCNEILEKRLHIGIFINRMHSSGTIDESNYFDWKSYYPIVLLFLISICLIVSLYIIFCNNNKSVYAIVLLFAGLGAHMVVAFSPTIWVSSSRTFIAMYFVYAGITAMLANEVEWKHAGRIKYLFGAVTTMLVVYFALLVGKAVGL